MPSRRTVLAAVAAALAGCSENDSLGATTPTPTPTPTLTPGVPVPESVNEALASSSRFSENLPCPGNYDCFHRTSLTEDLRTVAVPDDELVTESAPETTVTTYNLTERDLLVDARPRISRWTELTWVPVVPIHERRETATVPGGETIDRTLSRDIGRDGIYAVVEYGAFDPTGTTPRPPYERREGGFWFGALVEVKDSTWELTRDESVATEREGSTLVVGPAAPGQQTLVLVPTDQTEGFPVVPETLAAFPPLGNAVLAFGRADVDRVRVPAGETAMTYLDAALIRPTEIDEDRTLRLDDVLFRTRLE